MAARQVSGFMSEHANDLVGRLGSHDCAGVDEDAPSGNEGVEGFVVDENHLDATPRKARGLKDRRDIVLQKRLDLGISDNGNAPLLGMCGLCNEGQDEGRGDNRSACKTAGQFRNRSGGIEEFSHHQSVLNVCRPNENGRGPSFASSRSLVIAMTMGQLCDRIQRCA